ncbi:MAG TPA: DUF6328 family protein [Nocardioides sp.]|jgi:hypothetical protein|uniref:DUF6328 family protein n=1 Tax=Nocardioides sp. TaxID=35761 RepID=UPI002B5DA72A|nr:DUF6328 family protein [Nocardioides sp.]HTW18139.1 DUF6328 family protein [Nocardioides sp.]
MEHDAHTDRHETRAEQQDRKWEDLLQELRVMQTGAQLTAGFLLTLPFQETFWERLNRGQEVFYLALVVLAGLTTVLVMTPVAIHRRLSGGHVKERVVASAHRLMTAVLTCLALLVVGITTFIFDVVVSLEAALVTGAAMGAVIVALLLVVPGILGRD